MRRNRLDTVTTRTLRKDIQALCVALIALISQMFFGVVHATSILTAAAGPVAQVEVGSATYHFLQICSAGGLLTLDEDGHSSGDPDPSQCPVCASAAIAPLIDGISPAPLAVTPQILAFTAPRPFDQILGQSAERHVFVRGPPLPV